MTTTLTTQSLIRHFGERLKQIDKKNFGDSVGKVPQYPQLVVYLGENAMEAHESMSAHLLSAWPQYAEELKFVGVDGTADDMRLYEFAAESAERKPVDQDGLQGIVSSLFGAKMHFADRGNLLIYYVLDTTPFRGKEDFLAWVDTIRAFKEMISVSAVESLSLLTLLLNENLVRQKIAAQIRNALSTFYQPGDAVSNTVGNVLLLSNRRNDNTILEDWQTAYRILSSLIQLTNNSDHQTTDAVFSRKVMTVGYAWVEKPVAAIGQVVVQRLLEELHAKSSVKTDGGSKLLEDRNLPQRLGLTEEGTFRMLDEFAENQLFSLLPTQEQLELFPRRDDTYQMSMASMSARAFSEYTLGAWDQFLEELAEVAKEKVRLNSGLRQNWGAEYRKQLVKNFSKDEIMDLADRMVEVDKILASGKAPSDASRVLEAARDQLKYLLSSDEDLVKVFSDALKAQGKAAEQFTEDWKNLRQSALRLHPVKDSSIINFYERKTRNFLDRKGLELYGEFANVHELSDLRKLLENTLDALIDDDMVFVAAFQDELQQRLNADGQAMDANQYVRSKLTGEAVNQYLQVIFALDHQLLSAVMMKNGSDLHKSLQNNLAPGTYYYNTGSFNCAETIEVYQVSADNLVNKEEA